MCADKTSGTLLHLTQLLMAHQYWLSLTVEKVTLCTFPEKIPEITKYFYSNKKLNINLIFTMIGSS